MKKRQINVRKELRRLIRDAVYVIGGSGGRRICDYCLRESYPGQPAHYRVDVKGEDGQAEADEPCQVDIFRAALKELSR